MELPRSMNLLEIARQTLATFKAHKMRIFLTMFGIVWGIASVILLVGLGRGFSVDQKKRMETLGKDLVIVWGGRTSSQVGGLAAGREIVCVWPAFQTVRSLQLGEGRLITEEDESEGRRVVILGDAARKQLFSGKPAVGANLEIKGVPYTVIGVLKKKTQNSNYSGPDNDFLFAPYSAVARDFPRPEKPGIVRGYVNGIVFEVSSPDQHEETVQQVRRSLGRAHHFDENDKDALFIWVTMDGAKLVANIFTVITIFFGCVAIITLCLGGIGVMNIMLVSVTER